MVLSKHMFDHILIIYDMDFIWFYTIEQPFWNLIFCRPIWASCFTLPCSTLGFSGRCPERVFWAFRNVSIYMTNSFRGWQLPCVLQRLACVKMKKMFAQIQRISIQFWKRCEVATARCPGEAAWVLMFVYVWTNVYKCFVSRHTLLMIWKQKGYTDNRNSQSNQIPNDPTDGCWILDCWEIKMLYHSADFWYVSKFLLTHSAASGVVAVAQGLGFAFEALNQTNHPCRILIVQAYRSYKYILSANIIHISNWKLKLKSKSLLFSSDRDRRGLTNPHKKYSKKYAIII